MPSGVREQPIGLDETRRGALERARGVQAVTGARYGVGLEGGVELAPDGTAWLIGMATVISDTGLHLESEGPRMPLPPCLYEDLVGGKELGPLIDVLSGVHESKTGMGAVGWLTGGLVPRETLWLVTLACALGPLFRPEVYGAGPAAS